MYTNTLEQLELENKDLKKIVEFAECVKRLQTNKDFIKVVQEAYLKDEALQLVSLMSDPNHTSQDSRKYIERALDGISHFQRFLEGSLRNGELAIEQIAMNEETQQELIAEGLLDE